MRVPGCRSPQTIAPPNRAHPATGKKTNSCKHNRPIAAEQRCAIPRYARITPPSSQHTDACLQEKLNDTSTRNHDNDTPYDQAREGLPLTDDVSLRADPRPPAPPLDEPHNIRRSGPKLPFPCDPPNAAFCPPPEPSPLQKVTVSPQWKAKNLLFLNPLPNCRDRDAKPATQPPSTGPFLIRFQDPFCSSVDWTFG